jgi:type IV pilus assembly protein PilO
MALIPSDPQKRNALFIGILAVAAFYFFWAYVYSPRNTEVQELDSRLTDLAAENRRAQILATRGGTELEERLALYERHVSQLERLIPQSDEVAALLNDITREARRIGVDVTSMHPEPEEQGPFYTKKTHELEVLGEYHDVGRFLAAIASLARIVTPIDLELFRYEGEAAMDEYEAPVAAQLRIQTYLLPGEGERPMQPEPGTTLGEAQ